MALGSTQPLNRNEYQEHFLGVKAAGACKADNLPPYCAVVTKSGNLNFLEPSGPVQACNGTALPLQLMYYFFPCSGKTIHNSASSMAPLLLPVHCACHLTHIMQPILPAPYSLTILRMEGERSPWNVSKKITNQHVPEDCHIHQQCFENLKSHNIHTNRKCVTYLYSLKAIHPYYSHHVVS